MKCVECEQDFNVITEMKVTDVIGSNRIEYRCVPCFQGEATKPKSKKAKKPKKDESVSEVEAASAE